MSPTGVQRSPTEVEPFKSVDILTREGDRETVSRRDDKSELGRGALGKSDPKRSFTYTFTGLKWVQIVCNRI